MGCGGKETDGEGSKYTAARVFEPEMIDKIPDFCGVWAAAGGEAVAGGRAHGFLAERTLEDQA